MIYFNDYNLPCVNLKATHTQEVSKRYLGGKAIKGDMSLDVVFTIETDEEALALYEFYNTELKGGISEFYIDLTLFGLVGLYVVKFVGNFVMTRDDITYNASIKLNILSENVGYVVDDNLVKITDDSGAYITVPPTSVNN